MRIYLLSLFIFIFLIKGFSQDSPSDTLGNKVKYAAIPVVFYLPETKLGFGAAGIATFRLRSQMGIKPSQIQFAAVYTLKKQLLIFMPYEVYFDQDKTRLFGEIGYFNYFFNYYGQGVDSKAKDLEIYNANFPRAIVSALRRVSSKWYVGGQYIFDNYNINDVVAGSNVDRARGSSGGVVSSIGAEVLYDGRDQLIYPSKGSFLNVKSEVSSQITGATYQYQKLELDFRNYTSVTKGHIIASNVYMGLSFNEIPFFQQYFISSGTKLRGFNDRRFQDNNMVLFQTEYRYPIYKRLDGVAFYGVGTLNNKVENLLRGPYKQSGGLGLRFLLNKRDLINLRLDYAFTNEGGNFYATVKEAF